MKITPFYILFVIFTAIFVIGCAQPPIAEMESAREAVFRAENDPDAVQYSNSALIRARFALTNMENEADSKRYDAARIHASEAIEAAEKAVTDGKEAARNAAQRASADSAAAVSALKPEIEETSINVNEARYTLLDLDYNALDNSIVNAYNTADRAEADQAAGRYQDALDKARDIRSSLVDINRQIASAAPVKKK